MATPKLKTASTGAAPVRTLRPSGTVAAKQPSLKSATGKTIVPKKPAAAAAPKAKTPATPAPKPIPTPETEETLTPAPVEEQPVETTPAPVAEAMAETAPVEDAAAQAAADDEAARLAMEEYERQMAEYNRQMEEYNRQMAEFQAAEEIPAEAALAPEAAEPEAEAQPAPTPTEKLKAAKAAKPAGTKTGSPVKKKKKAPSSSSMSDDEIAQREAYMRAIQEEEQRKPVWKTVPFMVGSGLLVATIGICTVMVLQKQAENERIQAHIDYTNSLLRRAQQINQQSVENLTDAQKKNVDVSCTMADAKALMEVVVDPYVKGENGKPRYGARAEGVAQNACLLLGLAAEQNDAIRTMIFDTMAKECVKMKPTLFHWLLQRVAISDTKGVNADLKKLAKTIADKKTAKPWVQKSQYLAYIWECIGLRVTESDTKEILDLLKSDTTDNTLANNLCICLNNIITMMDDPAEKARIGDEIFTNLSEKLRSNTAIVSTLAGACSPKALEFYKSEIASKGWTGAAPFFIGGWGNDDILDYVLEQKNSTTDNEKAQRSIGDVIGTILKQDRARSLEDAEKLLNMCFDTPYGDTARMQDISSKVDPDSVLYIGDTHPDLAKLKEEYKSLEALRKQKQQIIRVLGSLSDHEWVVAILTKYKSDKDEDIQYEAEKALEKAHANAVNAAMMREGYKKRSKE